MLSVIYCVQEKNFVMVAAFLMREDAEKFLKSIDHDNRYSIKDTESSVWDAWCSIRNTVMKELS
jgi:hypothetical protein